jgi:hypothetical protein
MGALSAHHQFLGPKGFDFSNLAGDVTKPLLISADIRFSKSLTHNVLAAGSMAWPSSRFADPQEENPMRAAIFLGCPTFGALGKRFCLSGNPLK